jgi:hypothetical protein
MGSGLGLGIGINGKAVEVDLYVLGLGGTGSFDEVLSWTKYIFDNQG